MAANRNGTSATRPRSKRRVGASRASAKPKWLARGLRLQDESNIPCGSAEPVGTLHYRSRFVKRDKPSLALDQAETLHCMDTEKSALLIKPIPISMP